MVGEALKKLEPLSGDELALIGMQIGRTPRGSIFIAHRCPFGKPDVITTSPLLEESVPFPTIYWLTCPVLCSEIGRLESSEFRAYLRDRLERDPYFQEKLEESEAAYVTDRQKIMEELGILNVLDEMLKDRTGVGGAKPGSIKCFHAHYAHFIVSGNNPVGKEIHLHVANMQKSLCEGECFDDKIDLRLE